jgi:hypothetical protein
VLPRFFEGTLKLQTKAQRNRLQMHNKEWGQQPSQR